jgi:outer membrane protein TolC
MSGSDPYIALAEEGKDSLLAAKARASRDDLQALALQTEAARAGASAARGGFWPSVELSANYSYLHPNPRYRPVIPEFYGSWDVGVNLLFDIWNWGRTARQVEQAEATLKQAEQSYALSLDNATLEVRRAALTARRSREKLDVAHLGVSQAEENLRVTSDRYRGGLATSSDLLDAEVALEQASTNMTGAMIEYAMARARLERAVGRQ